MKGDCEALLAGVLAVAVGMYLCKKSSAMLPAQGNECSAYRAEVNANPDAVLDATSARMSFREIAEAAETAMESIWEGTKETAGNWYGEYFGADNHDALGEVPTTRAAPKMGRNPTGAKSTGPNTDATQAVLASHCRTPTSQKFSAQPMATPGFLDEDYA